MGGGGRHFCYDALRKILGVEWSKFGALRNVDEKIENALIDRVIYKVDPRLYDRAKTQMIEQNLFAQSS